MTKKQFFALSSSAKEAKESIILRCIGMVTVVPLVSWIAISMYPEGYLILKILTPVLLVGGYIYGIILEYRNYQILKENEAGRNNTSEHQSGFQKLNGKRK